ncbi:MAG: hypothetical protein HOO99_13520 [Hyphomicrobiaceae bacterium]|nr:hypothetical protein [Hyphomicrobiaceae bacterium]
MTILPRLFRAGGLLAALALPMLIAAPLSHAGNFDIKDVDVEKGSTEVGTNNTFFSGYPINADPVRSSHEIAISRGMTDRWSAGIKANFDRPVGDDLKFSTVGTEHILSVKKFENGFGFALFGGLDVAIDRDATNTVTFGPLFKFGTEDTSFGLNTLFGHTFGRNSTDGIDFTYAWNIKQAVRKGFAIGIEGHGLITDIANAPGTDFQEHRIGPVLYFERELGRGGKSHAPMKLGVKAPAGGGAAAKDEGPDGPVFKAEVGILFGLTDGTQDRAFKIKGGISF